MRRLFKRKKPARRQSGDSSYARGSAYHYSARRADVERSLDRGTDNFEQLNSQAKRKMGLLSIIFGGVIILVCGIYMLGLSTDPKIVVYGKRDLLRNEQEYSKQAKAILEKSLSNRSKLTINTQKIETELTSQFAELSSVEVSTSLIRHKPIINLTLASPSAILNTRSSKFLLDENGRALFDINKDTPKFNSSRLPLIEDKTEIPVKLGKPALTSAQVSFIYDIVLQSESRQLKVSSMDLVSGGGELDVRYEGLPYFVKFNFFEDARKSSGTFFAAKERLELENKLPTEYIDVRIPERAYVK